MAQSTEKIDVLDKGFVRLIDFMGGDDRAVQAARVSLLGKEAQPILSNSATISSSGALVHRETTTIRMLETTKAGSSA